MKKVYQLTYQSGDGKYKRIDFFKSYTTWKVVKRATERVQNISEEEGVKWAIADIKLIN